MSKRTATAPSAVRELEQRSVRFLGRVAKMLSWPPAERERSGSEERAPATNS